MNGHRRSARVALGALVYTAAGVCAAIAVAAEPRLPGRCHVVSGGPTGAPPAMGATEYYRFECPGGFSGDVWRFGAVELAEARFNEDRHDIRPTKRFGDTSF